MKLRFSIANIFLLPGFLFSFYFNSIAQKVVTPESKALALLQKMTLQEKVGQMAQITLDVLGKKQAAGSAFQLDGSIVNDAIVKYKLGSVLNTSDNKAMTTGRWNQIISSLQIETAKTRLKIPLI